MQMEQALRAPLDEPWQRGMSMERVILSVRTLWFGAQAEPMGTVTAVIEPGGEMIMFLDGGPGEVDEIITAAALRRSYVVATSFARPQDLGARLRRAGFRVVMRQAAYAWDPSAAAAGIAAGKAPERPERRGFFGLFDRRERLSVAVHPIGPDELGLWNQVCWRAFGKRGSESESLREKLTAFRNMAGSAHWYLARANGAPVGTAILYQGREAAQVLAVGTDPSSRGRGVATAVMNRLIADWQREGSGFLFLDTTPGSSAEQLYLRLGFRQAYLREVFAPPRP